MPSPLENLRSLESRLPDTMVRDQLERILASGIFSRSERLSAFLRFTVEETLAGRGDTLKEQVLAAGLYGRHARTPTDDDSIVRTDARRLRDKLREYYAEFNLDPVIISLPKGSYAPVFEQNTTTPDNATVPRTFEPASLPSPRSRSAKVWIAGVVGIAALGSLLASRVMKEEAPRPRLVSLTTYPGIELDPSLSPDGNFVAFAWSGAENPGPTDIWVKAVDSEAHRRITETPTSETAPAWSPDGKEIAFARRGEGVFVISQLGGAERNISPSGQFPKWTPDGRSILIRDRADDRSPAGIFQVDLRTLQRRQITSPDSGEGDGKFEVSPDGRTLAFLRYERPGITDIYAVPVAGGQPQRLSDWASGMSGLTWTPDSREIVFETIGRSLWRVPAQASRPGKGRPLSELATLANPLTNPFNPSLSRPGAGRPARLAFETRLFDLSMRIIDLDAHLPGDLLEAKPFLDAVRIDIPGGFSSDGGRIAFESYSAGILWRVCLAGRDGSGFQQISSIAGPVLRVGSWSPDGRHLVVEAALHGNSDIYVLPASGGEPKRLTDHPAMDAYPSWSRDGRWIYYSSARTGRHEVWKMPAEGGTSTRITREGGVEPVESLDARHIFYLDRHPLDGADNAASAARLMMVPVDGGEETNLFEVVHLRLWGVTSRGIAFVTIEPDFDAIDLYRIPNKKVERIGRLPFRVARRGYGRVVFAQDGRQALANTTDRWEGNLMMIDNFR